MTTTMSMRRPLQRMNLGAAAAIMTLSLAAGAQGGAPAPNDSWRLSATVGAWASRDALILSAGGSDTRLRSGPALAVDLQYQMQSRIAIYGGGVAAFASLAPGASLQGAAAGPSDQATVLGATGGLLLSVPGGIFGRLEPTLRLGGGMKGYRFNLAGAVNQWRPAGDFGIGLRGGGGTIDAVLEARYLPSSFDQAKLPTRSIIPQEQRQTDFLVSIGFSVRP